MSDHNLAEALRALLSEPDRTPEQRPDRWRAALKALAAHEAEQQAGEAVAWVDERAIAWLDGRSRTATITTKLQAGKSLERPMPLFTHPQQPLTKCAHHYVRDDDAPTYHCCQKCGKVTKDTK